jgi:hypothetical protein
VSWDQFRANWIVNDYAAHVKRHGPASDDRWLHVWVLLRLWWLGLIPSPHARARLREVIR